jgi:hypothetical protein
LKCGTLVALQQASQMVQQHRERRTRRRHRRPTAAVLALCAVLAVIAVGGAIGVTIVARHGSSAPGQHSQPQNKRAETPKIEFAAALAPTRAVYRYSVIEGGAYTPDELAAAIQRDPLVAEHYRAIHAERVRAEVVEADRPVYVSYKRGNKIYWTAHTLLLRKGETILTDGVTQVRSRCGNCISLQPMLPTAEDGDKEPEAVELDALVPGPVPLQGGNALASIGQPPAAIGQSPFALEDVIAEGLIGGILDSPFVGSVGGIVPGTVDQGNPGGITFPDVSVPGLPDVPGIPGVPDVPGIPGVPGVPGDVPGNPPGQPPPVLVDLPPPFGPPVDPPKDFTPPNDLPPDSGPVPVPEPGTLFLVGSGALSLILRRLRSKE